MGTRTMPVQTGPTFQVWLGVVMCGDSWPVLRKPFSPTVLRTEVTIRLDTARENTAGVGPQTHPRYPIQCPVHYTGDHEGHGVTKNLSLGGCLLKVAMPGRSMPISRCN